MPDIPAYYTRDRLVHVLELAKADDAAITKPLTDLPTKIHSLAERVDAMTGPHWGIDFGRQGDGFVWSLRAKHPQAHEACPISMTAMVDASTLTADAADRIRFGRDREVEIHPVRIIFKGPEWLRLDEEGMALVLGAPATTAAAGRPLEFRFADGSVHSTTITFGGRGIAGISIDAAIGRGCKIQILAPDSDDEEGRLDFTINFAGIEPHEVVRACQLRFALTDSEESELYVDGHRLARMRWNASLGDDEREDLQYQLELAEDLAVLQRHARQYFPVPTTVTGVERAQYRATRLLLDGYRTTVPLFSSFTATLTGGDVVAVRKWLESKAGAICVESDWALFEIACRTYRFEPLTWFHPHVEILNGEEALAAVDEGTAAGFKVKMLAAGGQCFTAFMRGRRGSDEQNELRLWNVPGIHEPGQDPDMTVVDAVPEAPADIPWADTKLAMKGGESGGDEVSEDDEIAI